MATPLPSSRGLAPSVGGRVEALLQRHWWRQRPSWLARCLQPLSVLYAALAAAHRLLHPPQPAPVPVLVVGNVVVGGAGKTPTVLAAVRMLQAAGHRPAVLSRGYGRQGRQARQVLPGDSAQEVGDEPLLMQRRSGVPVWVGADRLALARQACASDPGIDVLVCDDGLQHHRLGRSVNLLVFDERGVGNGLLLPAGPLRQRLAANGAVPTRVLYNAAAPSTALHGDLALRSIAHAWPLQAWWQHDASAALPLAQLQGRPLTAAAGLAAPEKFFSMLEAAGLHISRLPLPDHHTFTSPPWPAGTPDVLVTEKDAVKLPPAKGPERQVAPGTPPATRVWVVPLDFALPAGLSRDLLALLFHTPSTAQPSNPP